MLCTKMIGPRRALLVAVVSALSGLTLLTGPLSHADPPPDSDLFRTLPVIMPTPSGWMPKFPFPYDQTRSRVTDADITAEREMCQWFTAQYDTLMHQIDRLQFNRIGPSGTDYDYGINDVQHQVDVVTGNVDRSTAFLTPRAQALTQEQDFAGDNYFPLYEGESFFHLWQYLDAVNNGIKSHQPDWFTGPAVQRTLHWGSEINRSHVCDAQ
jgi:hypothetical protein